MKKSVLRVVAMLLASVLFISELNVTAFAGEISEEGEITLDMAFTDSSEEDAADVIDDLIADDNSVELPITEEITEEITDDVQGEILLEEELASDESDIIEEELLTDEEALYDDSLDENLELCGIDHPYFNLYIPGDGDIVISSVKNEAKKQAHLDVPDYVTAISSLVFWRLENLKSITLPNSLKVIEDKAFYGACNLESITIPESVTSLGHGVFYDAGLKEVTINTNKLTNLEACGYTYDPQFGGVNNKIENISFGENVTVIPKYLFERAQLDSECDLVIPKQVTKIDAYAFDGASGLRSLSFEQGSKCTTIGDAAFNGVDIDKIVIPKTVTKIGKNAFKVKSDGTTLLVAVKDSYAYRWFKNNIHEDYDFAGIWTVTYNLNGGVNDPSNVKEFYTSEEYNFNAPTKAGYDFDGWYEDAKFTKRKDKLDGTEARNITLYAKWLNKDCTVTYDLNKGSGSTDGALPEGCEGSFVVKSGSAIPALPTPTREGYTFNGWFSEATGGTQVKAGTNYALAEVQTIYAHWSPNKYSVRVHSNFGTKDVVKTFTQTFDSVQTLQNPFVNTGYSAVKLNTQKDGTGENYSFSPESPLNLTDKNGGTVDLYIIWEVELCRIRFMYNVEGYHLIKNTKYPEDGEIGNVCAKYNSPYGDLYDLNGNKSDRIWPETPERSDNYEFLGWYCGSSEGGVEVTPSTINTTSGEQTLIAYWKEKTSKYSFSKPNFYVQEPGKEEILCAEVEPGLAEGGHYPAGTRIKIKADPGCEIYYTSAYANSNDISNAVDMPDDPITAGKPYEDEIVIGGYNQRWRIKAVAYKDGVFSDVNSLSINKRYQSSERNREILGDLINYPHDYEDALEILYTGNMPDTIDSDKIPEGFWVVASVMQDDGTTEYKLWKEDVSESGDKITVIQSGAAVKFNYLHVYYGNKILEEKTDYTVAYKNNTKPATDSQTDAKGKLIAPSVIISLKGNYSGKIIRYFNIEAAATEDVNINKYFAELEYSTIQYGGIPREPSVLVKPAKKSGDDEILQKGDDYVVEYYNNLNAGKATVVITGVGNYYGVITKTFTIKPYDICKDVDYRIKVNDTSWMPDTGVYLFKGQSQPFVYDKNGVIPTGWNIYDKTASKLSIDNAPVLVEGRDFTVKYSNNKTVANYFSKKRPSITVTGKGNYTGKYDTIVFSIGAGIIDENNVLITDVLYQNKAGLKPMIYITDANGNQLKEDKDYKVTLRYGNDVVVYYNQKMTPRYEGAIYSLDDIIPKGTNMVAEISGIGNFRTRPQQIDVISLTYKYKYTDSVTDFTRGGKLTLTATATDVVYADKTGILKPTVTLTQTDESGYKNVLKAGKDYEKNFIYEYAEDTLITRKVKKQIIYKMAARGTAVDMKKDIIPAGTKMNVVIAGKGDYEGTKTEVVFYVMPSIASAKFEIKPQTYAGKPVLLNKDDIKITIGKGANAVVLDKWDYEIVDYSKNTGKGKGTVTIKGIGKYIGTKSITFTINAAK